MNRVFKVIWNRTKGCYVVVAETAKNMTKRSSLSVVFSKMVGATALAVMLTGVMMPTDALGAPIKNGIGAQASNNGGIAIGDITNALGDYSVAIGNGAKAAGESTVGTNIPTSTVAIGQGAQALENGDIVIGRSAKSIVLRIMVILDPALLLWGRMLLPTVLVVMWLSVHLRKQM